MCHYKHYAHDDPFKFLGTQDITWHIDFSQIAKIAKNHGFKIDGFVSQANFLINSGALDLLAEYDQIIFRNLNANKCISEIGLSC